MNSTRLITLTVALAAVAGLGQISSAYAVDGRDTLAQASPGPDQRRPERAQREPRGDRPQLFSPEERQQFGQKMKNAKTREEREALRKEMRAAVEQRAKEKGIALPNRTERSEDRPQLTRQDHQQFQERWKNAKTPEEREALRKEMLATVDQRVKDPGSARPGPERRRGNPMAGLFSAEEREQFREKMKNAKTRDERRKLMAEAHGMAKARAKEKGMKLPEHGRQERRQQRRNHDRHEGGSDDSGDAKRPRG